MTPCPAAHLTPSRALLLACLYGLGACAGAPATESAQAAAERLYLEGMEQMQSAAFLEAQQSFQEVMKMPAYLSVTAIARLRLADALYHQQRNDQAIEAYMAYATRHDGASNVPYARFMVAKSFFEMVPSDFWLLPPVFEMDLSAVDKARARLERFVRRYPLSAYVTEAQALRDRCVALQLQQHAYVVRFYVERKQWLSVVFRLHHTMSEFPARAHTLANYQQLAQAYELLNWRGRALVLQQTITRRWPGTPGAAAAAVRAADLRNTIARAKAGGEANAEMPKELPPTASVHPETMTVTQLGD